MKISIDRLKDCKDFDPVKYMINTEYQKNKNKEYMFYDNKMMSDYCYRNTFYFIQSHELKKEQGFNKVIKDMNLKN